MVGLLGFLLLLTGLLVLRTEFVIEVFGTVEREDEFSVFASEGGVVGEVLVEEGVILEDGEEVLRIDSTDLEFLLLSKRREMVDLEFQRRRSELLLEEREVQPGTVDLMIAGDRRDLLKRISSIHADLIAKMEQLQRTNDIESTVLQQERVQRLRVELELLEAEVLSEWLAAGTPELEKRKLRLEKERLTGDIGLLAREIALLEKRRAGLRIRAPLGGILTRLDFPDPGLIVEKGDRLFTVADPESAYRVIVRVPERNVDRIAPGTPTRMESEVFDSITEGFIRGEVVKISPDTVSVRREASGPPLFEVEIEVRETPRPLVLGSRVKVSIILGERSLIQTLLRIDPSGSAGEEAGS